MKTEEQKATKRKELERLYAKCPPIVKPRAAARWTPFGINRVYELIHSGELRAFIYRGGFIISKEDLIDYLLDHCDDPSPWIGMPHIRIKRTDEDE